MQSLSRDTRPKGVIQITLGRAHADYLAPSSLLLMERQNPPDPGEKASIRPLAGSCPASARCKSLEMRLLPSASADGFGNPHALQFR